MSKENSKVGLLKYLKFDKESRADEGISAPVEIGRIKYFWSIFTKYNSDMLLPSLLFILTAVPMFAVFIFVKIYGMETLSYKLNSITNLPYFMSNIGIGISSSSSVISAKIQILKVYQIYYLAFAAGFLIMSIGLSGMMRISAKLIWKDSFITKKDTYGNNVPRLVKEFFLGVKKYWWQMLIFGFIGMVLIAGVSNAVIYFISCLWSGKAGAGVYILMIFACIIGVLGGIFLMYLSSFIVMYDIPFLQKMKNSILLTIQMFLPNFFILLTIALPLLLISVTSGFLNVVIAAALMVFGVNFYSLLTCNYLQYYSERIITPVYSAQFARAQKKKKK